MPAADEIRQRLFTRARPTCRGVTRLPLDVPE